MVAPDTCQGHVWPFLQIHQRHVSLIHLKIKTEYSFGKTFAKIDRCIERLKALGVTEAGIVDEGGTWGHVRWHKACRKAGIKPLLGVELIVSDDDDMTPSMWFLARNQKGLQELYHWTTHAHTLSIGRRPRLMLDDVFNMSDNIYKFAGDITRESYLQQVGAILDFSPASVVLNMRKGELSTGKEATVNVSDNAYAFPEDKESFELLGGGLKPTCQYIQKLKWWTTYLEFEDYEMPKAEMLRAEGNLEELCHDGIAFRANNNGFKVTD